MPITTWEGERSNKGLQLQQGIAAMPLKKQGHLWGLLFMSLLWISLVGLALDAKVQQNILNSISINASSASDTFRSIAIFAILIYLIESVLSPTLVSLWGLSPEEDFIAYIERAKRAQPIMKFSCVCYHYEKKNRYGVDPDTIDEGEYNTITGIYEKTSETINRLERESHVEQVVTHTDTHHFLFSHCEDVSAELTEAIFQYPAIRVEFTHKYEFGDPETEKRYENEKQLFKSYNIPRDSYFSFGEHCQIVDFHSKLLSIVSLSRRPVLMHWAWYVLSIILGVSWIYRVWFDQNTFSGVFHFHKKIFG